VTFSAIELGFDHSCGISTSFSLYCWGGNTNGQLGNGGTSTGNRTTPLLINSGFSQVSAGFTYSCGVRSATSAGNCWGINGFGQLGDSSKSQRPDATLVKGNLAFAEVVTSQTHSCGRTTGELVYCWGANINGRIGQDTLTLTNNESLVPLQVAGLSGVAQVVVGGAHSCARTNGGQVFCWGLNDGGQLGDNSLSNRQAPVAVVMPGGVSSFTSITAGSAFTCGVANTSAIYCWGDGANGQLANGGTTDQLVPGLITDP
jgi:alpha-tubulin suppressor-like RCC1 family protein